MDFLQNHIEALIFCATSPIKFAELKACLAEMFETEVPDTDIEAAIDNIIAKFADDAYSFQVVKTSGGYQFLTKPAYQASIGILLKQQSRRRLSTSALETLSIIAYKQPVTKVEMEQIRGVNCDYTVHKLLEKGLVEIQGKAETIGRPILYGTSEKFMDYFGLNTLGELPTPKDFSMDENQIGEEKDIDSSSAPTESEQ